MQKRQEIYAALNSGNQAQVAFATMLITYARNNNINQAKSLLASIIDIHNASSEYVPGSGEPPIGTMLREVKKTDFHIFTVKNKELSDYSLLKPGGTGGAGEQFQSNGGSDGWNTANTVVGATSVVPATIERERY